eukprot:Nitzschia sp. Nitz4//scaffold29_size155292//112400//113125//NITZ4_002677-RA/size155292-processed-gene-0.25-mRNA-1//1//CDS//3329546505//9351//frame0
MLEETDRHPDIKNVVSWLPCGTGFQILVRSTFINTVLPRFFKNANYKSFNRQLNLYKFQRCTVGTKRRARGAYAHPKFQRDRPDLLVELKRDPPVFKNTAGRDYSSFSMDSRSKPTYEHPANDPSLNVTRGGIALLPSSMNDMKITSIPGREHQVPSSADVGGKGSMNSFMLHILSSSWVLAMKQEEHGTFLQHQQHQIDVSLPTEQDIINEIIVTFGTTAMTKTGPLFTTCSHSSVGASS